ncbi:hypothetical protein RIF29_29321 [Crotalaria pallida]|uniref:Uncharacterized protein n=1 Tax=Crotalaria pallida TaxID=3830 RepID=A0AAN9HW60_CROPI
MQILQWLFRGSHAPEKESTTFIPSPISEDIRDKNVKEKDKSLLRRHRAYQRSKRNDWSKLSNKNIKIFAFVYRKDIPKACFYSTLNLKRLGSLNRKQFVYSMKMKREEVAGVVNKGDSGGHVGNKVLPITEAPLSSIAERNDQCDTKDHVKGEKKKTISKMKELLRWAASAKTEKGGKFNGRKVLMFRRRATLKSDPDDDQVSTDSPKISFRWDVESCSTTSSYSALSIASSSKNVQTQIAPSPISIPPSETDHITCRRKGNWITTDSECKPCMHLYKYFIFCGAGTMKVVRNEDLQCVVNY